MGRLLSLVTFIIFVGVHSAFSQYSLSGKILNQENKEPIKFAVIATPDNSLWAITNDQGFFSLSLPSGINKLVISCLGFEKTAISVTILSKPLTDQVFYVKENNLSLDEVVVTAQKKTEEVATSYSIDRNALTHAQIKGVSDILSQLPGGQTSTSTNLTSNQQIALRSASNSEMDNPTFGTAIEVDGVRLSNNASFRNYSLNGIEGVDTRNIAVNNIESIEVVTGLPSVEQGDLSSGLLKIHTRKGKSPFEIEVVTKPEIKSFSLNKGFDLGGKRGLLNTSLEHTRSIHERISPYEIYTRNNFIMTYRNTFGKASQPIELTYGFTGNLGGYDSESDPDAFTGTYKKQNDYVLRTNLLVNWLLNRSWITGIEFSGSINYSNRMQKIMDNKSASSSTVANHSTEEGYSIARNYDEAPDASAILISPGYWYQLQFDDDKPITYSTSLKADWVRKFGAVKNKVKIGSEFSYSGNYGKGIYYGDMRYAPTWRAYRYDEQPFVNTYSFYGEENATFPVLGKDLQVQAGVRSDITSIKGSEYGVAQSLSPRINAQYTLMKSKTGLLKKACFHAGWGDAVKLPSVNILYPRPDYMDDLAFTSTTSSDGTAFYAYYTNVRKPLYNPDLKWQRNRKTEIGIDMQLGKTKISLTAFRDKTFDPYRQSDLYTPFSYNLTKQTDLNQVEIPEANRSFSIDQTTGIVSVSDKTGVYSPQQLTYKTINTYNANSYYTNGSPIVRKGLEWIVDFGRIERLKTSIRVDGNYYYFKGLNETIEQDGHLSLKMSDGSPYKYIGYFAGSTTSNNGSITKKLRTNVTFTTHIPAIRMIFTLRIESCLYNYSQDLSEYSGGTRSYAVDNKNDYLPSSSDISIYDGNHYVVTYPLYYTSLDDPETKIPFLEKFLWAKENDATLYNDLTKLVLKTNKEYDFKAQKISSYFSGNINLTKEIGNKVSVSFNATNFFNNMGQVTDSQTGNKTSLYRYYGVPYFYYGLSLRLKI